MTTPKGPKPEKPRLSFFVPDEPYPLYVHQAGYWAKKIDGRVVYFARWSESAQEAERLYRTGCWRVRRKTGAITPSEQLMWLLYQEVLTCGEPGMDKATPLGAWEWLKKVSLRGELPTFAKFQKQLNRARRYYESQEKGATS